MCAALLGSQPLVILAPCVVHAPSVDVGAATRHEVRGLGQGSGVPAHPPPTTAPLFFYQGGLLAVGTLTGIGIQPTLGERSLVTSVLT